MEKCEVCGVTLRKADIKRGDCMCYACSANIDDGDDDE